MNNITYSQDNCKEETTSTWLIAVMQFGLKINFFKPFENFKLKMKKVKYSVYQKIITTMMSIVIGCETTKDINEKLAVEKLAANIFEMDKIPDQSQINLLLTRMDSESISQLSDIHHEIFMEYSNSIYSTQRVVVDCDQTGLIANGKNSETVAMFLDSGNTHCSKHYYELLNSILYKYQEQLHNSNLILRTDSGFGSSENIEKLLSIPKLKFITKGYSTIKAKKLAKNIPYSEYTQADEAAWVYEIPADDDLRYIIVQTLSKKGNLKYSLLISNISRNEMSAVELFHFYNKRQTIEAFF